MRFRLLEKPFFSHGFQKEVASTLASLLYQLRGRLKFKKFKLVKEMSDSDRQNLHAIVVPNLESFFGGNHFINQLEGT